MLYMPIKNIHKDESFRKVKDHCYFTDKYWDAAYYIYN